ncbi:MAG: helix-turn-helix domain-containing protein [Rhodocyclaceae bacterium]|nr:helix-turn-helix domain-containing protein [Rhodocyclaceae bacterium]
MKTNDAISHFGTKAALADALGIKPPSIYDWGDEVPIGRQFQLELITEGALKATRPQKAEKVA